jgi:tetratricopeptide (TPR) repeat protein
MKRILLYIYIIVVNFQISANAEPNLMEKANQLYEKKDYQSASILYEQQNKQGECVALYYNLGNCYYRQQKFGLAILNYERALRLDPGDADARHNLDVARAHTIDQITEPDENVIFHWVGSVRDFYGSNVWAILSIVFFMGSLFGGFVYWYFAIVRYRKIGFGGGLCSFLLFVVCLSFSSSQKNRQFSNDSAVICVSSVTVKNSPDSMARNIFVLHEGTEVKISDKINDFYEIELSNGSKGWLSTDAVKVI